MGKAQELKTLRNEVNVLHTANAKLLRQNEYARKRIKDLVRVRNGVVSYDDFFVVAFDEIYALLLNAVKITGAISYNAENFVKRALFSRGQVGYLRSGNIWTYISGEGENQYGFPLQGIFSGVKSEITRGTIDYERGGERYLIQANEIAYPLVESILTFCEQFATLDVGINQNIRAVRVPRFIAVGDEEDAEALKLSLTYANEEIEDGIPVIKISDSVGKALTAFNMNVELIADKLLLIKQELRNELLTRLGILTANSNKRERVQVGEVNAHVGECVDSIYVTIDCFNKQMESFDLPFRMELNGVIEDYYEPTAGNTGAIGTDSMEEGNKAMNGEEEK